MRVVRTVPTPNSAFMASRMAWLSCDSFLPSNAAISARAADGNGVIAPIRSAFLTNLKQGTK